MGRVARGKSVSTIPGSMAATWTPKGRHSSASASAIAESANLEAWYMPTRGLANRAPTEETKTTAPRPASRMAGTAAWTTAAAPKKLVSNIVRTSSRSTSSTAPQDGVTGVADQAVERAAGALLRQGDGRGDGRPVGHVQEDRDDAGAAGEVGGGAVEVADARDDGPAGVGELLRDGAADAPAGAGDENGGRRAHAPQATRAAAATRPAPTDRGAASPRSPVRRPGAAAAA